MSGNTFGTLFKVTTWGESHGPALGVIIDGCPAGIEFDLEFIQEEVDKRKPQDPKVSTTRKEEDKVEVLSGVFEGKTTGTPISLIVKNKESRSQDYEKIKDVFRPGHADFAYEMKYGHRDHRGGGRSSGRETVCRVMAGAVASLVLKEFSATKKTKIYGHTVQVGDVFAEDFIKSEIEKNPLKCADKKAAKEMLSLVEKVRKEKDSIGSMIEIVIENPPTGLGEPVFDKFDADLAKAFFSIGAVKGVEIGSGFDASFMKGSENNDEMEITDDEITFLSNNSGGISGGITDGNIVIASLAIKPPPSIAKKQKTITSTGENTEIEILGRHDACLAPRVIPVAENMAKIILLDHLLRTT
ncbi:chorismate synthase [Candidatus Peregrinibacteria bacterium]|jgi:chorismate synthase|nr:chorismate synthase [Candidatus Peregrinibacteria bacterium]MBT4148180.1 chorismate synthase [Candidatus Peregrinibacteria bacterium]MBT4365891.1 chorismate synthase [Candidatus Peregrinibacteria bacterium]MBT4455654.1 chorismate synthase [Candidatus Peregrinibacteria bacterium]